VKIGFLFYGGFFLSGVFEFLIFREVFGSEEEE
jgi:hypothetical protein